MGSKKKYYAVVRGRRPGIYRQWFGAGGAEAQVKGFPKARYKGFGSYEEARRFMEAPVSDPPAAPSGRGKHRKRPAAGTPPTAPPADGSFLIYTDGGAIHNPGPGGYGVVTVSGGERTETSGGYRRTTNNRMELTACIRALEDLPPRSTVALYTDSKYVVNGITKGWAERWRENGWMRTKTEPAVNPDLWGRLLDLCAEHRVSFNWVKGHAGHPENERCDELATTAARQPGLPPDNGYEG